MKGITFGTYHSFQRLCHKANFFPFFQPSKTCNTREYQHHCKREGVKTFPLFLCLAYVVFDIYCLIFKYVMQERFKIALVNEVVGQSISIITLVNYLLIIVFF